METNTNKQLIENPTLSIIVPIYNGSKYLRETISGFLLQPCKDFELILIDDGSTDNSLEICREFQCSNLRIETQKNLGVSKTRNKGIDISRGKIIIFSDQDDMMKKDFYTEKMRDNILNLFKEGVEVILPGCYPANHNLTTILFKSVEEQRKGIFPGQNSYYSLNTRCCFHANIYNRSLFEMDEKDSREVRFFPIPIDIETTFRYMSQYAAKKLCYSDDFSFSILRVNSNSVSSNWKWEKVFLAKVEAFYDLINWQKKYYPEDSKAIKDCTSKFIDIINEMILFYRKEKLDINKLRRIITESSYFIFLEGIINKDKESYKEISTLISNPEEFKPIKDVSTFKKIARYRYSLYKTINTYLNKINPNRLIYENIIKSWK